MTIGAPAFGVQAAHALAPKTLAAGLDGFMRAYFRRARKVPHTDGNLFGPPADPGGLEGGFKPANMKAAIIGGAVAAVVAGGLLLRFSRRTSAR